MSTECIHRAPKRGRSSHKGYVSSNLTKASDANIDLTEKAPIRHAKTGMCDSGRGRAVDRRYV
jgi:hypothetical protein